MSGLGQSGDTVVYVDGIRSSTKVALGLILGREYTYARLTSYPSWPIGRMNEGGIIYHPMGSEWAWH